MYISWLKLLICFVACCALFFQNECMIQKCPLCWEPRAINSSLFRPGVDQNTAFYTWPAARNCVLSLYFFKCRHSKYFVTNLWQMFLNCYKWLKCNSSVVFVIGYSHIVAVLLSVQCLQLSSQLFLINEWLVFHPDVIVSLDCIEYQESVDVFLWVSIEE